MKELTEVELINLAQQLLVNVVTIKLLNFDLDSCCITAMHM